MFDNTAVVQWNHCRFQDIPECRGNILPGVLGHSDPHMFPGGGAGVGDHCGGKVKLQDCNAAAVRVDLVGGGAADGEFGFVEQQDLVCSQIAIHRSKFDSLGQCFNSTARSSKVGSRSGWFGGLATQTP